jgi:hypothetical protein
MRRLKNRLKNSSGTSIILSLVSCSDRKGDMENNHSNPNKSAGRGTQDGGKTMYSYRD